MANKQVSSPILLWVHKATKTKLPWNSCDTTQSFLEGWGSTRNELSTPADFLDDVTTIIISSSTTTEKKIDRWSWPYCSTQKRFKVYLHCEDFGFTSCGAIQFLIGDQKIGNFKLSWDEFLKLSSVISWKSRQCIKWRTWSWLFLWQDNLEKGGKQRYLQWSHDLLIALQKRTSENDCE